MKGLENMTKLKKALLLYHDEWQQKMDDEFKNKTPEEIAEAEESAKRVWERIKKELGVNE